MKKIKTTITLLTVLALLLLSCDSPTTTNKSIALRLTPDFEKGAYILTVEKEGKTATITENLYPLPMLTPSLTSYALLDGKVVYLEGIPHEYYIVSPYDIYNYDVALKIYDLNTMSSTTLQTASDIRLYKTNDTVMAIIVKQHRIDSCIIGESLECQSVINNNWATLPNILDILPTNQGLWITSYGKVAFIDRENQIHHYNATLYTPSLYKNYLVGNSWGSKIHHIVLSPSGQSWNIQFQSPYISEGNGYSIGQNSIAIPYVSSDGHIHIYLWNTTSTVDITTPIIYKNNPRVKISYQEGVYNLIAKVNTYDVVAHLTLKEDGIVVDKNIAPYFQNDVYIFGRNSDKNYGLYNSIYALVAGWQKRVFSSPSDGCLYGYVGDDSNKVTIAVIDGYMQKTATIYIIDIPKDGTPPIVRTTLNLPYSGDIKLFGTYHRGLWVVIANEKASTQVYYIAPDGQITDYTKAYLTPTGISLNGNNIDGLYDKDNLWLKIDGHILYLSPNGTYKVFDIEAYKIYLYKDGIIATYTEKSQGIAYITPDGIKWNTKDIITDGNIVEAYTTPPDTFYKTYKDIILLFYIKNHVLHMVNLSKNGSMLNDKAILTVPEKYTTVSLWSYYENNLILTIRDNHKTLSIAILQLLPSDNGYEIKSIVPIHSHEEMP
ncbi:hypothetical protein GM182_00375 [bacterium 3DAC]|nr:hypothetical protein GM182_00375 [bacterium 3DAC]